MIDNTSPQVDQGGESSEEGEGGVQQPQDEQDIFPGAQEEQDMQNLKETMLRKMSNDPSEFLRRKFLYFYQKDENKPQPPQQEW